MFFGISLLVNNSSNYNDRSDERLTRYLCMQFDIKSILSTMMDGVLKAKTSGFMNEQKNDSGQRLFIRRAGALQQQNSA
jgi:hypothetical protein